MSTTFIYTLNCPKTGAIRYVGKANDLRRRISRHIRDSQTGKDHRCCWIRSLTQVGLTPRISVLMEVPESQWQFWERWAIRLARKSGCDLTNTLDGGDAPPDATGIKRSFETRAKISAAQKGRYFSLEHRAAISAAQRGIKLSPEHRASVSAALKGKPWSEARRRAHQNKI